MKASIHLCSSVTCSPGSPFQGWQTPLAIPCKSPPEDHHSEMIFWYLAESSPGLWLQQYKVLFGVNSPTSTLTSIGRLNWVRFSNLDVLGGRYSNHHRTSKCPLHRTSIPDIRKRTSNGRPKTNIHLTWKRTSIGCSDVREWKYFGPYNFGENIGENKHPLWESNPSSLKS
jgi:hypothetical protein